MTVGDRPTPDLAGSAEQISALLPAFCHPNPSA